MGEQKHTQGEWKAEGDWVYCYSPDTENSRIAEVFGPSANAHLIAAAPELLGATRKAIASGPMKIEPTPETFESVETLPDNTMIDFRISVATYKTIKTAIAKAEKP